MELLRAQLHESDQALQQQMGKAHGLAEAMKLLQVEQLQDPAGDEAAGWVLSRGLAKHLPRLHSFCKARRTS